MSRLLNFAGAGLAPFAASTLFMVMSNAFRAIGLGFWLNMAAIPIGATIGFLFLLRECRPGWKLFAALTYLPAMIGLLLAYGLFFVGRL